MNHDRDTGSDTSRDAAHDALVASLVDQFVTSLDQRPALPPLHPTQPYDRALSRSIRNANLPGLFMCGLLIWNDDLQAAHPIAQDLESADGSVWHAIIHRREGDYWNAKYWYRRAGAHPVLQAMAGLPDALDFLKKGAFDASAYVDACEQAISTGSPALGLQTLQLAEIKTLLAHSRAN
jgi:hypothetical protein